MRYNRASNNLIWGTDSYRAVSGPHGKGPLPGGSYIIRVRNAVHGGLGQGYTDPITGRSWFIPIDPNLATARGNFGIHPDGGVSGTRGCIGLVGADAERFFLKWDRIPIVSRPTNLRVEG